MYLYLCFRGKDEDVCGPDAHEFRPECWLEMKEQVKSPVGVYSDLHDHAWSFAAHIEC